MAGRSTPAQPMLTGHAVRQGVRRSVRVGARTLRSSAQGELRIDRIAASYGSRARDSQSVLCVPRVLRRVTQRLPCLVDQEAIATPNLAHPGGRAEWRHGEGPVTTR